MEDECPAEPQDDDNQHCAEELAHGVRQLLAGIHAADGVAVGFIGAFKAVAHFALRVERLHDAQAAEGFFHLRHEVAPLALGEERFPFQLLAYRPHEPAHHGQHHEGEQRELPADGHQRAEVGDDEDGVLEQHVQRTHDGGLHLLHVAAHAGDDVAFALLREEAEGKRQDFAVELVADVAHHARADGDDHGRGEEVAPRLQEGHHGEEQAEDEQGGAFAQLADEVGDEVVEVVDGNVLQAAFPAPRHELVGLLGYLEQDLQDGDDERERENVEQGRQEVESDGQCQVFPIGAHEAAQQVEEFFHATRV